ncbi:MAG: hypothetical protein WBG11_14085 [Methylocella sp.]
MALIAAAGMELYVSSNDTEGRDDAGTWESLYSDASRPFRQRKSGRIAVTVINHLGNEVMKVFRMAP